MPESSYTLPSAEELRYLKLLAKSFPTVALASTEIINLEAILNLPKGTEHFLTDIHGESEAFQHVLKNASGTIKRKVNEIFGNSMRESQRQQLCTLIYYPKETLRRVRQNETELDEWYHLTLNQLVKVARNVSSKYTRSKVNKALPKDFSYIIQELLHESDEDPNKNSYYDNIISSIVSTERADAFIIEMCNLIQRLSIDSLHIVGDIYDRGPGAHRILDTLCDYHHVDVQWGNHDLLWMGAAAGNEACIANVLRVTLRYANLATLEDGYGINMLPLATFAMDTYTEGDFSVFMPIIKDSERPYTDRQLRMIAQMHKAITVIQWKLEGQLIERNPDYCMEGRRLLDKIDYARGIITLDGKEYELSDKSFPTIDPADPYKLTPEESAIAASLKQSFFQSEKLRRHLRFLLHKGSFYLAVNNNLLFHASVPLNEDGSFKEVDVLGAKYSGRDLLDRLDRLVNMACAKNKNPELEELHRRSVDYMWYLWCGPDSPSFDKSKMATLESYLIADKDASREEKGWYYTLRNDEATVNRLLEHFGLDPAKGHVINGHVPVKTTKGESPVRAGGKLLVIDGGFSRAYQTKTGIAGYTLVFHSRGLQLVQHNPFVSRQKAIEEGEDIISNTVLAEYNQSRLRVKDTDKGRELQQEIADLQQLLSAYRHGLIKEKQ